MTGQPKFKESLSIADLALMDRDLTFHPSPIQAPQYLTPEQIAHYNREAYINGLRVLSNEEVESTRALFDEILARVLDQGAHSYSIGPARMKYGAVWDLLTHPRIGSFVKDLLGDEAVGWGASSSTSFPGTAGSSPGTRTLPTGRSLPPGPSRSEWRLMMSKSRMPAFALWPGPSTMGTSRSGPAPTARTTCSTRRSITSNGMGPSSTMNCLPAMPLFTPTCCCTALRATNRSVSAAI